MTQSLYVQFQVPPSVQERRAFVVSALPASYTSYLFDFEKGDYRLDSSGDVMIAPAEEEHAQWILKTLMTERYSYSIYDQNHGVEFARLAREGGDRPYIESRIRQTITDALRQHPDTVRVEEWVMVWLGDILVVDFAVFNRRGARRDFRGLTLSGV